MILGILKCLIFCCLCWKEGRKRTVSNILIMRCWFSNDPSSIRPSQLFTGVSILLQHQQRSMNDITTTQLILVGGVRQALLLLAAER